MDKNEKEDLPDDVKFRSDNFRYLREVRVSHVQAIYISLLVALIFLIVDAVFKEYLLLKIIIVFLSMLLVGAVYTKMINQAIKPVIVADNAEATVEEEKIIKTKDGQEFVVLRVSDIRKNDKVR